MLRSWRASALVAGCWLAVAAFTAEAAPTTGPGAKAASARATPHLPFELELGKSTLEDAEARWNAGGATVASRGYEPAGGGMAADGSGVLADRRAVVVDITPSSFEGFDDRIVRLQFFDGLLYAVGVQFSAYLNHKLPEAQQLDTAGLEQLRQALTKKYGPPAQSGHDMFSTKVDVYVWKYGSKALVLNTNRFNASLAYGDTELVKKVLASARAVRAENDRRNLEAMKKKQGG